jgi:hypoxanthine phosphoribosyltransferase
MSRIREDLAEILLTEETIQRRLDELAAEIQQDYAGKDLTMVGVLTGSVLFVADLLRRLPLQLRLDNIGVSSYHGGTQPGGEFTVTKALRLDVRNRDVLVVDDILDTGGTLLRIREMLTALQPRSVRYCVFLEKEILHTGNIKADYVAFKIPNTFVVGYGLDYRERYRNLPYVATLRPEAIAATPA